MLPIQSRQSLTYLFVSLALLVALLSLLLSNRLVSDLAVEEREKMEVWALATETLVSESMAEDGDMDMSLVLRVLEGNTTIPLILYDKTSGEVVSSRNLKVPEKDAEAFLMREMMRFERKHRPIELQEMNQLLYYDDSFLLKKLQLFPYLQLLVITLFVALAFLALNRSRRAEQNRVWVGLSKETAHQLGTPISSLMAWLEYLKLKEVDPVLLSEIDKDVERLQIIAERFSKVGSTSGLAQADLREALRNAISYMEQRVSKEVTFELELPSEPMVVNLNGSLFDWVIENLTKNGVDAMQGQGVIIYTILEKGRFVFLDVTDTGKGLSKSQFKAIFLPGYTTKERGWGLGLSLVKRIVEENHGGKIFVRRSEPGKGTTFRIRLPKN
ncbi:MAG TPA: HAMP domain-containing histidine kinase [Bacteroidales bacterium]|jgi:two-component system, sporulation sensor kinase D|nr:HAMP domain-containing histidine kinase [Bacteroidales bacterium]